VGVCDGHPRRAFWATKTKGRHRGTKRYRGCRNRGRLSSRQFGGQHWTRIGMHLRNGGAKVGNQASCAGAECHSAAEECHSAPRYLHSDGLAGVTPAISSNGNGASVASMAGLAELRHARLPPSSWPRGAGLRSRSRCRIELSRVSRRPCGWRGDGQAVVGIRR